MLHKKVVSAMSMMKFNLVNVVCERFFFQHVCYVHVICILFTNHRYNLSV